MRHNHIATGGHWAVSPCSDGKTVLVQIGDAGEARQARVSLAPGISLHMAGDLLAASNATAGPRPVHFGEYGNTWQIVSAAGICTITLHDSKGNADPNATVAMPASDMRAMARAIAETAVGMI